MNNNLGDAIRKARGIDLTEDELHSTIKGLSEISNKLIHGDVEKPVLLEASEVLEVISHWKTVLHIGHSERKDAGGRAVIEYGVSVIENIETSLQELISKKKS